MGNLALAVLLTAIAAQSSCAAGTPQTEDPASYLTFTSEMDGRCQILSAGGKLKLMRNSNPSRAIRYRLVRYFANVPQPGRVDGEAPAGGEPVKLGCTLVDNVEQRWEIQRAAFVD